MSVDHARTHYDRNIFKLCGGPYIHNMTKMCMPWTKFRVAHIIPQFMARTHAPNSHPTLHAPSIYRWLYSNMHYPAKIFCRVNRFLTRCTERHPYVWCFAIILHNHEHDIPTHFYTHTPLFLSIPLYIPYTGSLGICVFVQWPNIYMARHAIENANDVVIYSDHAHRVSPQKKTKRSEAGRKQ